MSDNINEMVKGLIQTQVIQALNSAPEAIEKLVKAALSRPVDQSGKFDGYGNKMPYLDWLVGEEIRSAARNAVHTVLAERASEIEQVVRDALSAEDTAKAVTKAVVGAAEREWSIKVSFAAEDRR